MALNSTTIQATGTAARGGSWFGTLMFLGVIGVGGTYAYVTWGDAAKSLLFKPSTNAALDFQTTPVKRADLLVTVTESGNVESGSNIDLKCQVEGGSQILSIIPEGTKVTKGTELVRLASSTIEEQIVTQKIAYEKARSVLVQAEKDYDVAVIAVKEYVDGTYRKEEQTADAAIVVAQQNLKSAQNTLEHSKTMFRKGYANRLQLATNEDSVRRAELDLEAAMTTKRVLADFTKAKTIKQLESTRETAAAKVEAERASTQLEKKKLDRLMEQLQRCVIVAPSDGMVIYANDTENNRGGSQGPQIEEGAQVREFQTIIRLPDLEQMQVKVSVHETKIDKVRIGQPAKIQIRDYRLFGTVVSVSSQSEPGNWFSSGVKRYTTYVKIDGGDGVQNLKPGMTSQVEILCREVKNALVVPLVGVVELGGNYFSYVTTPTGYEKRPIVIGDSNDTYIEIRDGLKEGDNVILNPRALIEDARQASAPLGAVAGTMPPAKPESAGGPTTEDKPKVGTEKKKSGRRNLMSFDANKDGKVTPDEVPEQMKAAFPMMDTDKDGAVSAKEAAEATKRFEKMRAEEGGGGPPQA